MQFLPLAVVFDNEGRRFQIEFFMRWQSVVADFNTAADVSQSPEWPVWRLDWHCREGMLPIKILFSWAWPEGKKNEEAILLPGRVHFNCPSDARHY